MERVTAMEELFERNCCIGGYHVYKEVFTKRCPFLYLLHFVLSTLELCFNTLLARVMACDGTWLKELVGSGSPLLA